MTSEKKHVYRAEVMALPPIRMVLGDIPSPNPERSRKPAEHNAYPRREMEPIVHRLIHHLKEK
ncbi:MAG: hypothetical protein FJZ96_11410 [Chloroflexi bacterium]|nr:hypothetical protein [Chloroflexota bacterium]